MAEYLKIPNKQISIAVSDFTQQILTANQARAMISDASYQVVPGFLESYSQYNTYEILIALLPLSQDRLIDICLPFTLPFDHDKAENVLARFILMDGKLSGIRLRSSQEWPIGRCERMSPPTKIMKYYRQNNIRFRKDEVLIGIFCLQFIRCRIGLLFQSQIIQNSALLDIPQKYQYDIVSVTADVPRDLKINMYNFKQTDVLSRLKKLGEQMLVTCVYAGLRIAPSLTNCYNKKTFILQGKEQARRKTYLGERNHTNFLCNIDLTINHRLKNKHIAIDIQKAFISESEVFESLYIDRSLKYTDKVFNQQSVPLPNKKYFNDIFDDRDVRLLNLWYIFKTVNQGSPFILPYPFTDRCKQLYEDLIKLQAYCLTSKEEMIIIYRYKQGQTIRTQLRIYSDIEQMIQINQSLFPNLIYIYTDDQDVIKTLRANPKYGSRICNCDHLNPIPTQIKQERSGLNNNQIRKIQQACTYVLQKRLNTIDDILAHFRELNFSQAEIEHCFVEQLPKRIRRGLKPINIQYFLLQSTKQKIIHEIEQAEFRRKEFLGVEKHLSQPDSTNNKTFKQRVDHIVRYKRRLHNFIKCHRCKIAFNKTDLYECSQCKELLCYECIDILTNRALSSMNDYKCAICLKICRCSKCLGQPFQDDQQKMVPQQSRPLEMSLDYFQCNKCLVWDDKSIPIMFQCNQCKKSSCYACYIRQKPGSRNTLESNQRICQQCQEFNMNYNSNKNYPNLISSFSQLIPIEEGVKKSQRQVNKQNALELNKKDSVQQNSEKELNKQINFSKQSISEQRSLKSPQKKQTMNPRPSRASSSSISSSSDRKRRRKKKSSSSSSSRSRSRSRAQQKNRQREKQQNEKSSKHVQKPIERTPSKSIQKPLWNAGKSNAKKNIPPNDSKNNSNDLINQNKQPQNNKPTNNEPERINQKTIIQTSYVYNDEEEYSY